jgi:short-subunit dehydrogenase
MNFFQGKVIIVTGASEGIGAQLAIRLRERGAKLVLAARNQAKLLEAANPDDLVHAGDLTQESVRTGLIAGTIERFGHIDILINNAGRGSYFSTLGTSLEEARALFEVNFFAPFALTQMAAPHIRQARGSIVNVSSIAGQIPLPWLPLYSASKFALSSVTSTLRMELQPDGVHVMGVFPGYVNTGFQDHAAGHRPPSQVKQGKRFAVTVEECAEAIIDGIARRKQMVVTPRTGWPLVWAGRLFPGFVEARLMSVRLAGVRSGS